MIVDVKQGTDEWLKVRLGKLTASDAQAIATNGKGLETLCFEKVAETMTGRAKEAYSNEDMERGHKLEMDARNAYELETGNTVVEVGFYQHDQMPEVGCSPDGMVGEDGLVEIKCPSDSTYARYLFDKKVDPKYFAQMQMQMWVTDRKWCDYVVYNENFEKSFVIVRVERDQKYIDKLVDGVINGAVKMREILEAIK